MRGQEDTSYGRYTPDMAYGPSIRRTLAPAKDIDLLLTERDNIFKTTSKGSNRGRISGRNDTNNKKLQ